MDRKKNEFIPNYSVAPGETIKQLMAHYCVHPVIQAVQLEISLEDLHLLLDGKIPLTDRMAVRLSRWFHKPVDLWLKLERNYRDNLKRGVKKWNQTVCE